MTLLIIYAVLSIFFSFLCSILEAVLLSVTPTFISVSEKEGKGYAADLKKLKADVDKPLIAILTLNTIAHTVGAILVGVQAESLDWKVDLFGINAVGIISSIMTILILVVSEIIPKTIGATYWKSLVGFTTKTLKWLMFPLRITGILWLLQLTTKLIGGKSAHGESVLSREDFHAMADIAEKEGVFEQDESKIMKNLINFKNIPVKDIMTPSTVMKIASLETTVEDFYNENKDLKHSRIPLYGETQDEIRCYFLKYDLLDAIISGRGKDKLVSIKRELIVTTRDTPIPDLFELFISKREHLALVVDEYGSVSGLVTQEDIIETLLGLEIIDESDHVEDMQQLAMESWEERKQSSED